MCVYITSEWSTKTNAPVDDVFGRIITIIEQEQRKMDGMVEDVLDEAGKKDVCKFSIFPETTDERTANTVWYYGVRGDSTATAGTGNTVSRTKRPAEERARRVMRGAVVCVSVPHPRGRPGGVPSDRGARTRCLRRRRRALSAMCVTRAQTSGKNDNEKNKK